MEDNKKKKVIIGAAIGAVVLIAVIVVLLLNKDRIKASTMRLLRIVGEVTLEDGKKKKTIIDNLRLADGNALTTGADSLASVALDDSKIISVEENSRAEFYQKGKKLELILTKGRLFFDVQAPLADNESLDIKSSTMVVGIRGTSGYVWEDPKKGIQYIYLTDGHTKITGFNPQTGQTEEITLGPGQRATAFMNDDGTFNTFQVDDVTEDDLPVALIRELYNNKDTWARVLKATGYNEKKLLEKLVKEDDDSSYISIEEIELPDEPEPEPKKEETKVEPEPEPEPEPEQEPEPEPEPVKTVASVDTTPVVQTPASVEEPEPEPEPEQSYEEPPAEQPTQQTAEQPAQQPAQQTNPTDPNSGTNTNTSTNNPNGNSLNVAPQEIDENSGAWILPGVTDGTNTWDMSVKMGSTHDSYAFANMSMGTYNGQEDMIRATIHSSDTLPPTAGTFMTGRIEMRPEGQGAGSTPYGSGPLRYTGENTYTSDVISLNEMINKQATDCEIWEVDGRDSYVLMSKGNYCVTSFDRDSAQNGLLSINLTNDTELVSSSGNGYNVDVRSLSADSNDPNADITGLKFQLETSASDYAPNTLAVKLWLNDDSSNSKTFNTSGADGNLGSAVHSLEISDIEEQFANIDDCDVLHFEFVRQ